MEEDIVEPSPEPPKDETGYSQSTSTNLGRTNKEMDFLYFIMGAVILALFIGFVAAFISVGEMVRASNNERKNSYNSLVQKVNDLEVKLAQCKIIP